MGDSTTPARRPRNHPSSGAGDEEVPLVVHAVAAVGGAAAGERLEDRVARLRLPLADDRAEPAGRHHRPREVRLVGERVVPVRGERDLGDQARLRRERLERAVAPQLGRVDAARAARRREAREHRLHQAELEPLRPAPHLDDHGGAGLRDPARLAQRGDHVVGEEERVEAADGVEAVVDVGETLQVALGEVGLGDALAGDREQVGRGVEPAHRGAVVGGGAQERAAAAADVEHRLAGADAGAADRGFVRRALLGLDLAPVLSPQAPGVAVALRAGGLCRDRHGNLLRGDKLRLIDINYGR